MQVNQDRELLDQYLRGVTGKYLIWLVVTTATVVSTVLGAYFGTQTQIEVLSVQVTELKKQVDRMQDQSRPGFAGNQTVTH